MILRKNRVFNVVTHLPASRTSSRRALKAYHLPKIQMLISVLLVMKINQNSFRVWKVSISIIYEVFKFAIQPRSELWADEKLRCGIFLARTLEGSKAKGNITFTQFGAKSTTW